MWPAADAAQKFCFRPSGRKLHHIYYLLFIIYYFEKIFYFFPCGCNKTGGGIVLVYRRSKREEV